MTSSKNPLTHSFIWLKNALIRPFYLAKIIVNQPSKEFAIVDFLKGLSVLAVILFHVFFAVFFVFKKDLDKLNQFIADIPSPLMFLLGGDKAVDVFFTISTFLLGYSLLKVHDKYGKIDVKRFYLHRFFRLYPLFLVALLLYGLADPSKLLSQGWYSLLFIENIFAKGIIPVQWSLSIEVQFYLILPFLMLFLARTKHPIRWLMGLIALSIAVRFWAAWAHPITYQTHWYQFAFAVDPKIYMDTLYYVIQTRITPLLLGVLWAVIVWKYPLATTGQTPLKTLAPHINLRPAQRSTLLLAGLVVLYALMLFPVYNQDALYYQYFSPWFNLTAITLHRALFVGLILALILLYHFSSTPNYSRTPNFSSTPNYSGTAKQTQQSNVLVHWRGWRLLSELAYPMYFFHFPFVAIAWFLVLGTIEAKHIEAVAFWQVPLVFALAVLMTLYLSLWLNHAIEARFIGLGKEIEQKHFNGHNISDNSRHSNLPRSRK
jgi:peptidoglycan/LPS O-acetylase OafA/YrhL